jgi:SH3-like domain-containing protein
MRRLMAITLLLVLGATAASGESDRKPPYWASIAAGKAMMRTGPGKNYPATWLYRRADLPIKVVETYPSWRKIQDPDGTTGWMLVTLLSDTRTALVVSDEPAPMHEKPDPSTKVHFLAAPGVVGRISHCDGQWCEFNVHGHKGYLRADQIWGTNPGEQID